MSIDAKKVKDLRDKTGAGMMDCKKALVESSGDMNKAVDFLRKSGITKAEKKSTRAANEGLIYSYIHHGNRLGVLLDIGCETDFVAKPITLKREEVDPAIVSREKEIYSEQAASTGKPEEVIKKIVEGKLNKYYQENCLLEQAFIKDSDKNIHDLISEVIATLGDRFHLLLSLLKPK